MKNLTIYLLFLLFFISCKKQQDISHTNTLNNKSVLDTIFLQNQNILFISPSDKYIEKLKKQKGDDFYTMADDANNYYANATEYLDSLKVNYTNYDDDEIIGYKINNKFIEIPKYKNPWYLVFYKNGKYETLDLIDIREEYSKFFRIENNANSTNLNSKKIIDSIAGSKYFMVKEEDCDLNNDAFKDKIVVFGNNDDIDPQNPDTKIAPIAILLNIQNKNYTIHVNEKIYPNNFGDAFKKIVVKNSHFTIELSNEITNQYTSSKYITFKYDLNSKKIYLFKYGENINWEDGKMTKNLCTEKDFGKIFFLNYNSNTIGEFCK